MSRVYPSVIKRARIGGLLFFASLALSGAGAVPSTAQPATVPASFDCTKATRAVDRFVCANAALRWQDLALSRSYRAALDRLTGAARAALVAEQRDWVGERDRRCVADRSFAEMNDRSSWVHDQVYDCLMTVYLSQRVVLGNRAAAPIATQAVREIDLAPITRARLDLAAEGRVPVNAMRLSPDGSHVAILLPSEETDFADQVWLYRVADGALIPATPRPDRQDRHPADAVSTINALAWQGETLFVDTTLWGQKEDEDGPTAYYAATAGGSRRLDDEPVEARGRWDSVMGVTGALGNDFPDDPAALTALRSNHQWQAWAADRGHGTLDLHVRARKPAARPYLLAWGGWELASFLFDETRAQLTYAGNTGIALFDLAARTDRRIAGTGRGDRPWAVSADRRTILWATSGRCGQERLADPEPDPPGHFCLATLMPGD